METLVQLQFLQADQFTMREDGYLHCKTVPFYILAQSYEGHYELAAGSGHGACEEGGAFFTPPNVPLRIFHYVNPTTGQMSVRFFHFMLRDERGIDPLVGRRIPLVVSPGDCREPAKLLHRLLKASRCFERQALALALIGRLYDLTMPADRPAPIPEGIVRVCNWIHQHAGAAVPLAQLLAVYGRARSKFYAEFLHYTQLPPAVYVRRERVRHAAALLLQDPSSSIKEIADRCGWPNPYLFSRVFKSVLGAAPGDYRLQAWYGRPEDPSWNRGQD